jgi:hypothetical protein
MVFGSDGFQEDVADAALGVAADSLGTSALVRTIDVSSGPSKGTFQPFVGGIRADD